MRVPSRSRLPAVAQRTSAPPVIAVSRLDAAGPSWAGPADAAAGTPSGAPCVLRSSPALSSACRRRPSAAAELRYRSAETPHALLEAPAGPTSMRADSRYCPCTAVLDYTSNVPRSLESISTLTMLSGCTRALLLLSGAVWDGSCLRLWLPACSHMCTLMHRQANLLHQPSAWCIPAACDTSEQASGEP